MVAWAVAESKRGSNINYNCDYCGKEFSLSPSRLKAKTICCSKDCMSKCKIESAEKNCTCDMCGNKFHKKPSHINKCKNNFCSKDCLHKFQSINFKGENNHQYGLKGKLNPTWKSDEKISHYGYRLIRVLGHPLRNSDGFVFEHRLVAERFLLTEENSIVIDGKRYLSPEYIVHHKDFNRLNNDVDNLEVMRKEDHSSLHDKLNIENRQRDGLGRFVS